MELFLLYIAFFGMSMFILLVAANGVVYFTRNKSTKLQLFVVILAGLAYAYMAYTFVTLSHQLS